MSLSVYHTASRFLWGSFFLFSFFGVLMGVLSTSCLVEWGVVGLNCTQLTFPVIFDSWGLLFAGVVSLISANVVYFAWAYMSGEMFNSRFVYIVLLFVFSMNMLIFFPNVVTLLLGWDGLGIVSFVLVVYYSNPKSLSAGMITALSNRIGDAMLLISIGWVFNGGHWFLFGVWGGWFDWALAFSVLVAAMTKSAQIPFSSWLPAAMAAPTPVSALVHSSTLVTAGVFLVIRFYYFLSGVSWFCWALFVVSCLTMFVAGVAAINESDMKKIVALSTLSQLGVMMMSVGLGCINFAMFHLITHAMFKALLFICVGGVIYFSQHGQDSRCMGNLYSYSPVSMSCFMVSLMALCGSPFMAGFYSKDAILESSLFGSFSVVGGFMIFFCTMLTAVYCFRLVVAIGFSGSESSGMVNSRDGSGSFLLPMTNLAIGSVVGGSVFNWVMISPYADGSLSPSLKAVTPLVVAAGVVVATFGWAGLGEVVSFNDMKGHGASTLWFLTPLSSQHAVGGSQKVSFIFIGVDQSWVEVLTAKGSAIFGGVASGVLAQGQGNVVVAHLMLFLFFFFPFFLGWLGVVPDLRVTLMVLNKGRCPQHLL